MDTVIVKIYLRTDIDWSILLELAIECAYALSSDVESYDSECAVLDEVISVEMVNSEEAKEAGITTELLLIKGGLETG
jgi:hypothetical protein